MQPGLFRPKALSRLSSPEQLNQLMRVTSPRSWLVFLALAAVIVAAVVWGFVGSVPTTVSAQAILIHQGGGQRIVATSSGQVLTVSVNEGEVVSQGQVIGWLETLSPSAAQANSASQPKQQIPIISPITGRIDEVLAAPGSVVSVGDPVATIEALNAKLEAYAYVPIGPGKQLKSGMTVQVSPTSVDASQYGYLIGHVQSVSDFPVTEQGLSQLLNNDTLTNQLLGLGPVLQVIVTLAPDPHTPSGFKWSSPKGPPFALTHGTLAGAQIIIAQHRPIHLVLPGV